MDPAICQAAISNAEIRKMLDDIVDLLRVRGINPTRPSIIACAISHGLDQAGAEEIADMITARLEQQQGEAA